MKKAFTIISMLILLQSCQEDIHTEFLSGDNKQPPKVDTLIYRIKGFNSGVTLALLSDSTFFYKVEGWGCMGGGSEKYTFGSYTQHKNKIVLLPERSKELSYWNEENPFDYSNPEMIEYPFMEDTIRIKTEFFRVDIHGISYLLSGEFKDEYYSEQSESNDFQELASHLKGKDEPYGHYLTGKKTHSNMFTIDDLPEQWKTMFR